MKLTVQDRELAGKFKEFEVAAAGATGQSRTGRELTLKWLVS